MSKTFYICITIASMIVLVQKPPMLGQAEQRITRSTLKQSPTFTLDSSLVLKIDSILLKSDSVSEVCKKKLRIIKRQQINILKQVDSLHLLTEENNYNEFIRRNSKD